MTHSTVQDPAEQIESCRTVEDLVCLLQHLAARRPTEDLAAHISAAFERNGVTERCLQRLSNLHRVYGADLGLAGYAINFVWSLLMEGVIEGGVVIIS